MQLQKTTCSTSRATDGTTKQKKQCTWTVTCHNGLFSMPPKSKGGASSYTIIYIYTLYAQTYVHGCVMHFFSALTASDDKLGRESRNKDCIYVIHIVGGAYHYQCFPLPLFRHVTQTQTQKSARQSSRLHFLYRLEQQEMKMHSFMFAVNNPSSLNRRL